MEPPRGEAIRGARHLKPLLLQPEDESSVGIEDVEEELFGLLLQPLCLEFHGNDRLRKRPSLVRAFDRHPVEEPHEGEFVVRVKYQST